MRAALRDVRARFGQKYPLVIDGKEIWTDKLLPSLNPSAPDQIVGFVAEAGIPEAESAVKAARRAFESWSRTPFEERCQLLERVAAILDRRRFELSAVEVFEVGKAWAEADGDIREAMDFCLFYAQQMRLRRKSASDPTCSRRRKLPALLAARRRARHRAVEFSDRDSLRNGHRRARHWQHRDHETGRAIGDPRRAADGDFRGSGSSAGCLELPYTAAGRSLARTWSIIPMWK